MMHEELVISEYRWLVDVFFGVTEDDADEVMECLHDMGVSGKAARSAYRNLLSGEFNTGLTFSKGRRSCIVIGKTTERAEFAHTFTHEIFHCAVHIASANRLPLTGEAVAYIAGDLSAEMYRMLDAN